MQYNPPEIDFSSIELFDKTWNQYNRWHTKWISYREEVFKTQTALQDARNKEQLLEQEVFECNRNLSSLTKKKSSASNKIYELDKKLYKLQNKQ